MERLGLEVSSPVIPVKKNKMDSSAPNMEEKLHSTPQQEPLLQLQMRYQCLPHLINIQAKQKVNLKQQ